MVSSMDFFLLFTYLCVIRILQHQPHVCVNCAHFIPHEQNYPYNPRNNELYGKCALYGKRNVVSGRVIHQYADICRSDDKMCGIDGKNYQERVVKKSPSEENYSL
jgi:hypothetical protein